MLLILVTVGSLLASCDFLVNVKMHKSSRYKTGSEGEKILQQEDITIPNELIAVYIYEYSLVTMGQYEYSLVTVGQWQ